MRSVRILALVSAFLAVAPAFGQDTFPDVPVNHWAYEALARMKRDGLLVGYPDGLFRGGRPASRYELAVAMHAVYTNLKNVTDGLDAQIRVVQGNGPTAGDIAALKDAVAALQTQLATMRGYGADIADLRRASDTFELELTQLGVDVQAMKDELSSLAGRIAALERKKPAIDIAGELDLWGGGGHGDGNGADGSHYGLTRDGRLTGIGDKGPQGVVFPATNRVGITRDLALLSEAAVTFTTTKETGVHVRGTLVATNAFGQSPVGGYVSTNVGFGNQSDLFSPVNGAQGNPSLLGYGEGSGDVYLQELVFSGSGKLGDLEAGRVRYKADPWIFQRIDNTLYYSNERWDDGKYTFDGGIASGHLGPVKGTVYAGTDNDRSLNGVYIDSIVSGPANGLFGTDGGQRLDASRILGGNLQTSVKGIGLRGDYLVLKSDESGIAIGENLTSFDQVDVYGGAADFHVGRFKASGGLRQSKAYQGDGHVEGLTGTAWDAKVAWASGRVGLSAQYRQVGLDYMAPGDWGRLGILRNPTNVRGFLGSATVGLTRRFSLGLEGETSHGLDNGAATTGTFFDRSTDIGRYAIRLDGKLGQGWDAYVSYEQTLFRNLADAAVPGDPRYQWYGFGVARALSANARFSLAYEQSAIDDDYQTTSGTGGNDFRGGFLTSQVTVKF